jgi:CheY-specific phosphatase CheX
MYFANVLESATRVTGSSTPEMAAEEVALAPEDFAFSLHFAGDVSGGFGVHLDAATARGLASNFLGEDESGLSREEVGEVVGELANMLCGSVVSRVEGRNKFVLSHPTQLGALPGLQSADALIARLDTDSGVVTAWVVIEEAA